MPVKINIDKAKVLAKIDVAWGKATGPLAEEILADCNEYCKMDTGALIASSLIHSQFDKGLLIWATPYARRQYYEIRTASKDYHSMATWRWAEVAKQHRLERWIQQAQILARRSL
jgi:hypothetical protein